MSVIVLLVLAFAVSIGLAIGIGLARARRGTGGTPAPATRTVASLDEAEFDALVRAEIGGGRTIEAIKRVRERTGLGLKEAKDVVEAMAAGKGGGFGGQAIAPGDPLADEAFAAQLLLLLAAGDGIEAIKLYRERTGLGLKEAKDAVEALERGS